MEDQSRTTLRDILYVLFRYKWLVMLLFGSILLGGILLTAMSPRIYEATSTVQIAFNNARLSMTSVENNSRPTVDQQIFTEIEFVKSWGVINTALEALQVDRKSRKHPDFTEILENLRVESIRNTTMIIIYYRNEDPELARDILNQIVDSYISFRSATTVGDEQEQRYLGMLEDLDTRIDEVDDDLNTFNSDRMIFNIDVQIDQESNLLEKLRNSHMELQRKILQQEFFLDDLKSRQADFNPNQIPASIAERDPALKSQLDAYNKLELEYLFQKSRLTENNPEMVQMRNNLESIARELKNQFASAIKVENSLLQMDKVEWDLLTSDIQKAQQRIQNLAGSTSSSTNMENRLRDLQSIRTVLSQKLEETRIQAKGDDRIIYSQVSPARLPLIPKSPNVQFNLLVSLVLALVIGLSTPFYVQLFDARVVSDTDVMRAIGQPPIATIRNM